VRQVPDPSPDSTAALLARVREGDEPSRTRLVARYLPMLRSWASGRLPAHARGPMDTDDLVQITLIRALESVQGFQPQREGAFLSYLRSILMNALRDQLRRAHVRRAGEIVEDHVPDPSPTVLDEVIGKDIMERYDTALAELTESQREAVILRLEFGYSHLEIADAIGVPSADAARMLVGRAMVRLAEMMRDDGADA
jgi:RNA polymerase sigma factor (sigma-70 family)